MTRTKAEDQIQDLVASFTADLSELIRAAALEAVEEALGSGRTRRTTERPKTSPAPRKGKRTGKRVRRTAEQLAGSMDEIVDYVKANPGQRLEEMSAGMNIDSHEMKRPIVLLLEKSLLRKEGARRGTRYFVTSKKKRK